MIIFLTIVGFLVLIGTYFLGFFRGSRMAFSIADKKIQEHHEYIKKRLKEKFGESHD